jgi:hypothetical protein
MPRQQVPAPIPPQALPKFNPHNNQLGQFRMSHSPAIHAENRNLAFTPNVDAEPKYAGNERNGR